MYKTIGRMGCDREVGEKPYRGGSLRSLEARMYMDYVGRIGSELLSLGSKTDIERYLQKSDMVRLAHPENPDVREAMCMGSYDSLTSEDFDEYPESSRIIGEHPIWKGKFDAGEVTLADLGMTTRDAVRLGWIKPEQVI